MVGGYILTISVYAFTFGHYRHWVIGGGDGVPRLAAAVIIIALDAVNLIGVGETSGLEIFTVWAKLAIVPSLAEIGLWTFQPSSLHYELAAPGGWLGVIFGSAGAFMAYQGF